ncbi:MAG: antibiotic biosynthesis monooxygenase family protein [Bacteroidota bacterium]
MITRIVRMEFRPDKVTDFLAVFEASKQQIRNFPGVSHLELHRDATLPHVFYTYSIWEGEAALEAYRNSDLFRGVWTQTKALFGGKPLAYSLVQEMVVD